MLECVIGGMPGCIVLSVMCLVYFDGHSSGLNLVLKVLVTWLFRETWEDVG